MKDIRICIFGDSITWGAWDPKGGGWPDRLKAYFHSQNYRKYIMIYNSGVSGDNTNDLLKRFKTETEARGPNVIIFAIGVNDSQYINSKDNPRINVDEFKGNLIKLIRQARDFNSKVIFIGLTQVDESKTMPIPWAKTKYYDNKNIKKYNLVIKSVCQENKVIFIEILDLLKKGDLSDGLHPNEKGHQKIFERVKDFLLDNKLIVRHPMSNIMSFPRKRESSKN